MKTRRQALILRLLDQGPVRSQEQLRRGLRAEGIVATQATISRDIKELGLVKRASDGAYQRASTPQPPPNGSAVVMMRAIATSVTQADQVQQLVVLKTPPGQANATAIAIDRTQLPEVVGTIAGDDTILVVLRDPRRAAAFAGRVQDAIGGESRGRE
jgi:transcriptional regulator of arginine metabolism